MNGVLLLTALELSFLGQLQQVSGDKLRWRRQGRYAAGLDPLLKGAPGGGVHGAGVGRHVAVEGVLDALAVLIGEAGGHRGEEALGCWLRDRCGRVLQGHNCSRSKCPITPIIGHSWPRDFKAVFGSAAASFMATLWSEIFEIMSNGE